MKDLIERIEDNLSIKIDQTISVHGGDISQSFALKANNGSRYFLKYNDSDQHDLIMSSERTALKLWDKNAIKSPQLIFHFMGTGYSAILLEYIDIHKSWNSKSIENFVNALVHMHSIHNHSYGFHETNCIGSLKQINQWYDRFEDYYWDSRIKAQIILANAKGYLDPVENYEFLYERFSEFPLEPASLIHGDLWSGNYIQDESSNIYFIDPSISYGKREMDLAMMQLFGGFPDKIFEVYNDKLPLAGGWRSRTPFFQLYYLLVHLNLFGTGFLSSVKSILEKTRIS